VAAAVTLFVYLLSRNPLYALATAVVFGTLAWVFRARDEHAEPIMLADRPRHHPEPPPKPRPHPHAPGSGVMFTLGRGWGVGVHGLGSAGGRSRSIYF
jgi:hypothetical protein